MLIAHVVYFRRLLWVRVYDFYGRGAAFDATDQMPSLPSVGLSDTVSMVCVR